MDWCIDPVIESSSLVRLLFMQKQNVAIITFTIEFKSMVLD